MRLTPPIVLVLGSFSVRAIRPAMRLKKLCRVSPWVKLQTRHNPRRAFAFNKITAVNRISKRIMEIDRQNGMRGLARIPLPQCSFAIQCPRAGSIPIMPITSPPRVIAQTWRPQSVKIRVFVIANIATFCTSVTPSACQKRILVVKYVLCVSTL